MSVRPTSRRWLVSGGDAAVAGSAMSGRRLFGVGVFGSIVAALCCTPLLAIVLGALGLSAWLAWSDYVVLPALLVFLAIAVYGFTRWRGDHCCETRHG